MSNLPSNSPETFNDVLADFLHRTDQGDEVDMDTWCANYPQYADNLRELAAGMEIFSPTSIGPMDSQPLKETINNAACDAQTEFEFPRVIDRYQLVRKLGSGAMGTVYLAENLQLHRQVALKLPHLARHPESNAKRRFAREAQTLARLEHPNVCRVDDAGEDGGVPFLVMEYIDGQSLTQCVGKDGYREPHQIACLVRDVAEALAYVHENRIVHRDIKPGNILIRPDGRPCITDFGLAHLLHVTSESRLTSYGTTLGTPEYMAPEQLDATNRDIGPACDVYALGVVLFELLTERLPFSGPVAEMTVQIISVPPPKPSEFRADVPHELESLCLRMLAKQPSARPASMTEVVRELDDIVGSETTTDHVPPSHAENRTARFTHRKRTVVTLCLLGGVFGGLGWWGSHQTDSAKPLNLLKLPRIPSPKVRANGQINVPEPQEKSMLPILRTNSLGMEFVRIPPGKFRMGRIQPHSPGPSNENPVDVQISYEFFAGTTEVTQSQYAAVCMTEPWRGYVKMIMDPDAAAAYVSWHDCCQFCELLTVRERELGLIPDDLVYRLPTEAEWEYFCRAGTDTLFSFGNDETKLREYAWWNENTDVIDERYAHRVAQLKPNPWGLYDVHGNVYEWCADRYASQLPGGRDPFVTVSGTLNRPNRGGSWGWRDAWACRSSNRRVSPPETRENNLGMRVVLAPPLP